ncbi:MAG: DUF6263 family protein [Phycisphaeraceae bacterium]
MFASTYPTSIRGVSILIVLAMASLSVSAQSAAPAPAAATVTIDLSPQFVQGRTTHYEFWSLRQHSGVTRMPDLQPMTFTSAIEMTGQVTWTVQRVAADGSAMCIMTINWATSKNTDNEGTTTAADSRQAKSDDEHAHNFLKAITNVPLTVQVAADGSITKVTGVDAIKRKGGEDLNELDELDFIEVASDLATLPGGPSELPGAAAVGKTWRQDYTWNHDMGKVHQPMRYTVSSYETIAGIGLVTVDGKAKTRFEPKKQDDELPVDVRMTRGQVTTQIMFDMYRHEAVGRNTLESRDFEVKVKMPDNAMITSTVSETVQGQVLRIAEK